MTWYDEINEGAREKTHFCAFLCLQRIQFNCVIICQTVEWDVHTRLCNLHSRGYPDLHFNSTQIFFLVSNKIESESRMPVVSEASSVSACTLYSRYALCTHKKYWKHNNELKSQHTDFNVEHIPHQNERNFHIAPKKTFSLLTTAPSLILEYLCTNVYTPSKKGIRRCDFHNLILNKPRAASESHENCNDANSTKNSFFRVYFYELNENKSEITTDERQSEWEKVII